MDETPAPPLSPLERLRQVRQQAKAAKIPEVTTNGHQAPLSTPGQNAAYVAKAVDDEAAAVRAATQPGRNIQLNKSAYNLGQLIGGGELIREDVERILTDAARACGLTDSEIYKTLRSGIGDGIKDRRTAPPLKPKFTPPDPTVLEPAAADKENDRTSWWPRPIAERVAEYADTPAPTHLRREDGQCLFYSGKVNGLIGESESGKSWIALLAVYQAIKRGERVLILDFEDSANSIYRRLQLLGMEPDVEQLVHYADPDESLELMQRSDLEEALGFGYGVVVVDGVNVAMTKQGYDLNSNTDATLFANLLMRPLARTGACVIGIDHVTKDPSTRTKGAIGAQAKRALITGCQLVAETVEPFGVGQDGAIKLTVDKDRNGIVRGISAGGKYAGKAVVTSTKDSMRIRITAPELQPATDGETQANWEPTIVMEKVSRLLEKLTEPCSFNALTKATTGKEDTIRKAIDVLHNRGHIDIQSGPRGSLLHRSIKPYRAAESDRLPTVARLSPGDSEETVSPSPPPSPSFGGGETGDSHGATETVKDTTVARETVTLLDVPDGYSHCNRCGQLTAEAEIELGDGYCLQCCKGS